jgi:hypothetical protein
MRPALFFTSLLLRLRKTLLHYTTSLFFTSPLLHLRRTLLHCATSPVLILLCKVSLHLHVRHAAATSGTPMGSLQQHQHHIS